MSNQSAPVSLRVFKSTMPSMNFIFGNGKPAIFVGGVFRTKIDWEIAALEYEIAQGHPHIFIDPHEKEIMSDMVDPMAQLRAKIIAEHEAAKLAASDPNNDRGSTELTPVKATNSMDIAVAAMGGSGAQTFNPQANANVAATVTPTVVPAVVGNAVARLMETNKAGK